MTKLLSGLCALVFLCFSALSFFTLSRFNDDTREHTYWAPISNERLVDALQDNLGSDDMGRLEGLATVVLERDPRKTLPRGALASVYAQRSDFEALEEIFFPLFFVDRDNFRAYATALAVMSTNPGIFEGALNRIREDQPVWGGLYLRSLLTQTNLDTALFEDAIKYYPRQIPGFLNALMRRDGVSRAYDAFRKVAEDEVQAFDTLIDPDFTSETFSWPFGWSINREITSREPNGGLSIVFFGRGTPVIAQQIMSAKPGAHTLNLIAQGEASRTKGYFRFEARCWQGPVLAHQIIDDLSPSLKTITLEFETPPPSDEGEPECAFVHVRLLGQAGAFPAPVRMRLSSINSKTEAITEDEEARTE